MNQLSKYALELKAKLPAFQENLAMLISKHPDMTPEYEAMLRVYLGEVAVGFTTILPYLEPGQRILEIGSGIGALGFFLAENGCNIRGIEPSQSGFDEINILSRIVRDCVGQSSSFICGKKGAEALNDQNDGQYDLIFSIHVLEHLRDPSRAIAAMNNVLKPGGQMVHLCPNYAFPYDPHFFVPIVFWSPFLTKFFFKKRIKKAPQMWESLNFISARHIKKMAKENKIQIVFGSGVMGDYMRRLLNDPVFAERHNGPLAKMAIFMTKTPIIHFLDMFPAKLASPMIVTLKKPN